MKIFNFDKQLHFSNNKTTISHIFGLLYKHTKIKGHKKADIKDDKNGVDYWITTNKGNIKGIDLKIRDKDFGNEDVALEIYSNIEKQTIGWTIDDKKITDYIIWYWCDTKRLLIIDYKQLRILAKEKIDHWEDKYFTAEQRNHGYTSLCVFVPIKEIKQCVKKKINWSSNV